MLLLIIDCYFQMPAGAISMFGPGTSSLLSEGLKKHHLSTSEESEKSEEVVKDHLLKITSVCVGRNKSDFIGYISEWSRSRCWEGWCQAASETTDKRPFL